MSRNGKAGLFGKLLTANLGLVLLLLLLDQAFGVNISDTVLVVCLATMNCLIVAIWAYQYWRFTRSHTPEQRAALATQSEAQSELRRDREKFAKEATLYKREVLRTGVKGRAVVTAAESVQIHAEDSGTIFDIQLAVTVGTDPPYVVRTGEYVWSNTVNAVKIGRELQVRVDPNNRTQVAVDWKWVEEHLAVDWKQAKQLRRSPDWRQEQIAQRVRALEKLCAEGVISDAEFKALRDQVNADTQA